MYFLAFCLGKFSFWECVLSCSIHFHPLPLMCDIFTYMYHHSSNTYVHKHILHNPIHGWYSPKTNGWTMKIIPFFKGKSFSKPPNFWVPAVTVVFGGSKNGFSQKSLSSLLPAFASPQGRVEEAKETLVTLRGDAYAETLIQEAIRTQTSRFLWRIILPKYMGIMINH